MTNKSSILAVDDIVELCASFYTVDEIELARSVLRKAVCVKNVNIRLPKHKGIEADKKRRTVTDIVKICLDPEVGLPVFYAVDLARLRL